MAGAEETSGLGWDEDPTISVPDMLAPIDVVTISVLGVDIMIADVDIVTAVELEVVVST